MVKCCSNPNANTGPNERVCTTGGNGSQNATFFLPTGTELALPAAWTCGTTVQRWRGVNASAILSALGLSPGNSWTMDVTLTYDAAAATLLLDLSSTQLNAAMALAQLDSPNCDVEPLPIDMSLLSPGVCE